MDGIRYWCRFLFGVWLSLSAVALHAQSDEPPPIQLKFTCLAWDGVDARGLFYQNDGNYEPLRISSSYRSKSYQYRGQNPLIFYRQKPLPDGTTGYAPVASVTVPEGMGNLMLIFLDPGRETASGREFKILTLDDGQSKFPWGTYLFYNLSSHDVAGIIGSEQFILPGHKSRLVAPNDKDKVDVEIHFAQKIDDQWVPKVNTCWLYRKDARSVIFIIDDTSSRTPRLKLKSIDQIRKP